ncbi:MAG: hypothetical protein COA79_00540 [Planctomycetota bacterium]|nr:MAG: hypothetical protein COA79_00540 [Planctomycetota bacterium]
MANKFGSDLQNSMGKFEKLKIWIGIAILVGLFGIAFNITDYLDDSKRKIPKIEIIKGGDGEVEDYDKIFDFVPNYDDFFTVEDELEIGIKYIISKGELEIRKVLGSKMYRAHPKLIQTKGKSIKYGDIHTESNKHKGQIVNVIGKVIKIRKLKKIPQILSKQFIHSVIVEDDQGGLFDCRSIRLPFDLSVEDVVSMSGVYIKLRQEKSFKKPFAILFGNSIQSILPRPFFWEDNPLYNSRLSKIKKETSALIDFPNAESFKKWSDQYFKLIESNQELWSKVNDDDIEKSKKLPPEFEEKLIENLSYTNKNTILASAKINKNYSNVLKNKNNYRRKINKIVGTIIYINEVHLNNKIGNANKVYYSKIRDFKGNEYLYNFLNFSFIDQMDRVALKIAAKLTPRVGDMVICSGVFIQIVQDENKKIPLIYGKRLSVIGSYEEIWDSIDHMKPGIDVSMTPEERLLSGTIDKRPYVYLLNKLSYMTPDDVLAKYNLLKGKEITTWTHFMTDAPSYVDKPYFKYGRVKLIREIDGLNYYDFHGMKKIYEMYIVDKESHLITLYSLNKPKDLFINERVFFDGYFFKKFTYANIGNHLQWNPLLVGHIHTVEKRIVKTMSKVEIICLVGITLGIVFFMVFVSKQHKSFTKRINSLRDDQFRREKLSREDINKLNETGKELDTSLLINLHFSMFDDIKTPLELCHNVDHWGGNLDEVNGQWRPEYLNSYVNAITEHYKKYDTELPKDLKFSFINKRKEMLGLRAYQKSKFELSEEERKRVGSIMITPISNIKNQPENLDRLEGYFDENGLPPWNTWISFSSLPKNVVKNPNAGFKPQTQVIISWVPVCLEDKIKNVLSILEPPPRRDKL